MTPTSKYARRPGPNERPKICKKSPPKTKTLRTNPYALIILCPGPDDPDTPTVSKFLRMEQGASPRDAIGTFSHAGYSVELSTSPTLSGKQLVTLLWVKPPGTAYAAAARLDPDGLDPLFINVIPLYHPKTRNVVAYVSIFAHYERN